MMTTTAAACTARSARRNPSRPRLRVVATTLLALALSGIGPPMIWGGSPGDSPFTVRKELMGTRFQIEVRGVDTATASAATNAAFAEVERLEEVLSEWSATSEVSRLNRNAGGPPLVVSSELMAVLDRARSISTATGGAFDVTFASCSRLWSIRGRRVPPPALTSACAFHIDFRSVRLDWSASAAAIADPEARVGLSGLAKGYRVDRAAAVLAAAGIEHFAVDGGGDLYVSGSATGAPWPVRIAHPRQPGGELGTLSLTAAAIATSGDYQWYFERDGVRYHHILDPATARPARRAVSATVLAPTAMEADALATALFVLGPERGIAAAERLSGVEALIVGPDLRMHRSSGFPAFAEEPDAAPPLPTQPAITQLERR